MCVANQIGDASLSNDEGIHVAWLVVCHDGWDSVIKQSVIGVSVYFIDPVCWVCYKLALSLVVPTGHGVEACAGAAWVVLWRYGIRQEDIDRSMNDTTNAPVATGRMLVGRNGTRDMHVANLMAYHTSGKRVRTEEDRIVVDEFPRAKTCASSCEI